MRFPLINRLSVLGFRLSALLLCALALGGAAKDDAISAGITALQRGDLPSAEQVLRKHLQVQPNDGVGMEVLGVVLDQEKKFNEADEMYRRALKLQPRSPTLLNNYGNHLLATGNLTEARKLFLEVIGLDPGNANASVQLARIALQRKAPTEAIGYLDRVPANIKDRADVVILTMQADYASGRKKEADNILARISPGAQASPAQSFALGVALSSVGQYAKAEEFFSRTLEATPANFQALHDLGLAASHAGHNERAQNVLQQALEQQPKNIDVLYDLAAVDAALHHDDLAAELLARAAQLAPQRTDVLQLLARTAAGLGYFGDAVQVWNSYLKLVPNDDVARRERAFAETAIGVNTENGLAELSAFVHRHPVDPAGHYELGTAESPRQPEQALKELNRALSLKPDLTRAHVARGLLLYRQGNPEAALPDFEFAAKNEPKNGIILDHLGETYMALGRVRAALPPLRKATEIMPSDSTILLHLGRALSKDGNSKEAVAVFARCRELGPNRSGLPHPAGLIDFLSLSTEEQMKRYRAGVERTVQNNPTNIEAQVRYLAVLLDEGKTEDAAAVARKIALLKPTAALLSRTADELLSARQYATAKEILEQGDAKASSRDLALDLAIATFHADNAQTALAQMDRISVPDRNGDYYLARAQMLQAQDRYHEADLAIKRAVRANVTHPELYREAALFLIKDHRPADALKLLESAVRDVPNDPEISVLYAAMLEITGNRDHSDVEFKRIENRWPQWYKVWIVNALVFQERQQHERASSMMETATALGAPSATVSNVGKNSSLGAQGLIDALQGLFR